MFSDPIVLPSQAIFPLGIAVAYLALCLYMLSSRKLDSPIDRLFLAYLLLTVLWSLDLVVILSNVPPLLPGLSWPHLVSYLLILLGITYWTFARAFLQNFWQTVWAWVGAGMGLLLAAALNMGWLALSSELFTWSNGWVNPDNAAFVLSVAWWLFFMTLAAYNGLVQAVSTPSPAHKNRIRYLILSTLLLVAGYGLYLTLLEPFWTTGLIIIGVGGVLATYTVVVENLLDLGTVTRWVMSGFILTVVTVSVYLVGIYLVETFLGDFLAQTLARYVDKSLAVAVVTALFLTVIYSPIRQVSQYLTNRLLFGQHYDYQEVIQKYTHLISNRLYLGELANVAMSYINQVLGVNRSALFILDSESGEQLLLRTLPATGTNGVPKTISLKKDTPITQRLIVEQRPLAQYTIDISLQFKNAPEYDRQTLRALNYEWFIPILKKEQLIGIFALGPKKSGRPYTDQDMRLLNTLADQIALALENATLFDGMQRNLAEITQMKNLMANVFDSMDNGVITMDILGKITLYNRAAEAILAVPSEECVGLPYSEVLTPLNNTIFPNLIANVARRENHYTDYEIISDLPGRGRVNLSLNLAPLKDAQDQTQGVTIVVDDVTETKRLRAVHDMFRRYVSPAVVDRLPSNPFDLQLGGHRQEVSILFADIRGFTAFSEKLTPEELVDTLNEYLSMAAGSILMFEGMLDKFIGDAVMGIFNAPLEQSDHILRAVRAAAAMQRVITDYHKNIGEERGLTFGVGIHAGEAVVGNVGMSDRMDYTAIGDTVNVAKRIQENAPGGKILMSEAVYQAVKNSVQAVFYQEMPLRGREQSVKTYELLYADADYR
ncbi:MAG: GAF domain-containing protein [Anaerolineales bacterium]|nr:GAF domain-containing protein [Anaerolineales bacterium]